MEYVIINNKAGYYCLFIIFGYVPMPNLIHVYLIFSNGIKCKFHSIKGNN